MSVAVRTASSSKVAPKLITVMFVVVPVTLRNDWQYLRSAMRLGWLRKLSQPSLYLDQLVLVVVPAECLIALHI